MGTMFGKVGALMGNILIGVFIDVHCVIPIIVSCSFLIGEYRNKIFNTILRIYVEYNPCVIPNLKLVDLKIIIRKRNAYTG